MKTSLKIISLLLAIALPATVVADLAGIRSPAALDPGHVFYAFVVTLTLLTVVTDYARGATIAAVMIHRPAEGKRAALAATDSESLRLAA